MSKSFMQCGSCSYRLIDAATAGNACPECYAKMEMKLLGDNEFMCPSCSHVVDRRGAEYHKHGYDMLYVYPKDVISAAEYTYEEACRMNGFYDSAAGHKP